MMLDNMQNSIMFLRCSPAYFFDPLFSF